MRRRRRRTKSGVTWQYVDKRWIAPTTTTTKTKKNEEKRIGWRKEHKVSHKYILQLSYAMLMNNMEYIKISSIFSLLSFSSLDTVLEGKKKWNWLTQFGIANLSEKKVIWLILTMIYHWFCHLWLSHTHKSVDYFKTHIDWLLYFFLHKRFISYIKIYRGFCHISLKSALKCNLSMYQVSVGF